MGLLFNKDNALTFHCRVLVGNTTKSTSQSHTSCCSRDRSDTSLPLTRSRLPRLRSRDTDLAQEIWTRLAKVAKEERNTSNAVQVRDLEGEERVMRAHFHHQLLQFSRPARLLQQRRRHFNNHAYQKVRVLCIALSVPGGGKKGNHQISRGIKKNCITSRSNTTTTLTDRIITLSMTRKSRVCSCIYTLRSYEMHKRTSYHLGPL